MKPSSNYFNQHTKGVLIVATGIFIISFDALLIRLVDTGIWNIVFWVGIFTFFSLLVIQSLMKQQGIVGIMIKNWVPMIGIGLSTALTTILFVTAIKMTIVANVMVLISISPLVASIMSAIFLKERPRLHTWIASIITIIGVVMVFQGSVGVGKMVGNFMALCNTISYTITLILLRRFLHVSRIGIVCVGGLFAAVLSFCFATPFELERSTYLILAFMGLLQNPLAKVLVHLGTRYISVPEVSLLGLGEVIFAPVLVWFVFKEIPPFQTFMGGGVIFLTLLVHTWLGFRIIRKKKLS